MADHLFYCNRCRRSFHVGDLDRRWDVGEDIIIIYCPKGHPVCAVSTRPTAETEKEASP